MNEQQTIEELKKQLEEAKAENARLEEAMQYKDKMTGMWNRKYAEKVMAENSIGADKSDFTIVCTEVANLAAINIKSGPDAGDALMKSVAGGLQQSLGEKAVCCKLVGTKMCAFLTDTEAELEEKIKKLEDFIGATIALHEEIDINYGFARKEHHPDKDASALMKEAEYDLQVRAVSKEKPETTPEVPRQKKKAGDEITILMIDDSLTILRTLQMMLKDTYKTMMTTNGMEGYEMARSKHPDLILLDYNMPVVDGERIMHLLKESNSTKNIPVIFISGVSDKEKILKVASMKPAGYLLKPVEKSNLLSVINTVLQS